jgi:cell wall-associated NlpC family hydrolase
MTRSHRLSLLVCLCATLLLVGATPAEAGLEPGAFAKPAAPTGTDVVSYAQRLLGTPYSYGGETPQTGFDCSGLVRFVFAHFGVDLPHSSYAQYALGRRVARADLRPGDLVFFDDIGQVGVYVGDGRFLHAPRTGTRVSIDEIDGWYGWSRFTGARRVISSS